MNHWKTKKHLWYSLALAVLLCMAFLVGSTGTAYARYRTKEKEDITISVREKELISLGTVDEEGVFTPADTFEWETIGDYSQLTFSVANGISAGEYSHRDQQIRVRMLGTLGLWTGSEIIDIFLHIPSETEPGETEKLQAMVTSIDEGTALGHVHGPGWIYSFQNSEEEELVWELPGGEFSYITLTVSKEGSPPQEVAALWPQVYAKVISE